MEISGARKLKSVEEESHSSHCLARIAPSKSQAPGFIESVNGRFRDGYLNEHLFGGLPAARRIIEARRANDTIHEPAPAHASNLCYPAQIAANGEQALLMNEATLGAGARRIVEFSSLELALPCVKLNSKGGDQRRKTRREKSRCDVGCCW